MNAPEGWKLVPLEMTPEMKRAALNKIDLVLRVGMPEYDLMDGVEMAWGAALNEAPESSSILREKTQEAAAIYPGSVSCR